MAGPAQRQPTQGLARREMPAPIPIAPGLMPDAEQLGRIALAVIGDGNLDQMSDESKTRFIIEASRMLGLNPVMSPFLIVKFEGRAVLYLTKSGAEQLAGLHGVSTEVTSKQVEYGLFTVTVRARQGERFADATGAVPFETMDGKPIPIAQRPRVIKIAETQARRRSILALVGLGFLDRPGMPDPDQAIDRHGNVAVRKPAPRTALRPAATQAELDALSTDDPPPPSARAVVVEEDAEAIAAARAKGGDTDADADDIWEEIKREPPTVPRWDAQYGQDVSELADRLEAAGKKFSLPAIDASDADVEGWIAAKRGLLAQTTKRG